jgi:hypothetical protein
MAAGTFQFYDQTAKTLMGGDLDSSANIMLALVTSSYTPNQDTDDLGADVSANEISSTSTGYTAGGYALTSPLLTEVTKGYKFSSSNAVWTAGASNLPVWYYAVMYINTTWNGQVNPLIGYFLGDSTPANVPITTSGNQLTIQCPAAGWFDITRP